MRYFDRNMNLGRILIGLLVAASLLFHFFFLLLHRDQVSLPVVFLNGPEILAPPFEKCRI